MSIIYSHIKFVKKTKKQKCIEMSLCVLFKYWGQLRQLTTERQIIFCVNGQYVTAAVSRNEHSFKY